MKKIFSLAVVGVLIGLIFISSGCTAPNTITVMYPHSKDFADHVFDGFKEWYSEVYGKSITIKVVEASSDDCLLKVTEWNGTSPEADVWWGGGEYNFEVARKAALLEPYKVTEDGNISASLGGWHLKDDSGTTPGWYAAAISGFGIMYNTQYLTTNSLDVPTHWDNLTDDSYAGHIVMADPDYSGSTNAAVKQVLQYMSDQHSGTEITNAANLTDGWQYWAKVAGNIGEFTTSSSKVPTLVNDANYGIGICIDYYALDKMGSNPNIGFNYGGATTVSPDPAGIIKGTKNLENAQAFMDYLIGTEGQNRVGKYRTPANKKATATAPVLAAWDASGNPTTSFPAITPFNPSLDGALHSRVKVLFHYWFVENTVKQTKAWEQIWDAATTPGERDAALVHYLKLPSNYNGTIAALLALDYKATAVTDLWKNEGDTNFGAAYTAAGGTLFLI
ncbi:MAG: ABC transporter substrate-binding protein [Candidatus Odinarchaeota archaeon]